MTDKTKATELNDAELDKVAGGKTASTGKGRESFYEAGDLNNAKSKKGGKNIWAEAEEMG